MKMTPLTMQELENKTKGSLYVINNTGNVERLGVSGVLIIAIPRLSGNGNPIIMRVPQTWLPIDLTLQVPYNHLISTSEFRNAVMQGYIIPISDEYAEYLLSKKGAQQERERLEEEDKKAAHAGPSRFMTSSEDSRVIDVNAGQTDVHIEEDGFAPSFIAKVNRWSAMEDIAVMNEIRSSGKFTRKQLRYIVEHLPTQLETKARIEAVLRKSKK